ncbi:transposase domain-containing protein [Halorhodospira sp. M39old]|uniref:transposase domain-containing protein n=1 Tax=Halorhodospira sp. M39old TaxID=2899131 RepID=UPI003FCEA8D6
MITGLCGAPSNRFLVAHKTCLHSQIRPGAQESAVIYGPIETAKLNGLAPHAYLLDVLENPSAAIG